MKRSAQFRQKHADLRKKAEAILAAASAETGELTADQQKEYDGIRADMLKLETAIKREEELEAAERVAPATASRSADGGRATVDDRAAQDPARGFHSHRQFMLAVMENAEATSRDQVSDERLRPLALVGDDGAPKGIGGGMTFLMPRAFAPRRLQAAVGSDEQGEYDDRYGGFAIPTTILPGVLSVGFEGDPTAGRVTSLPMTSPSVQQMARTDKNHTSSVSGGFTVTRKPETVAKDSSRMELEMITFRATGLFGLAFTTEELLADSPISFAAMIDQGFRDQFGATILGEKIRGGGGNEYTGVLGAPGTIIQAKEAGPQTADTIVGANVVNMRSRCWNYSRAIWLANHDTLPELVKCHIAGTNASVFLFAPGNGTDKPDTLLGRPIFFTEFCSKLGDLGDIILGDWSQFLEGVYQNLQTAESIHVRFVNHERAFKLWVRNCGAPWWRVPLTPNKSAVTLSPFVTLEAR